MISLIILEVSAITLGEILSYVTTAVVPIIAWVTTNKWIFPKIKEWWNERKSEKRATDGHNLEMAKNAADLHENTIEFAMNQIELLETKLSRKEQEFKDLETEVQNLKILVGKLQNMLIEKRGIIKQLSLNCCNNALTCPDFQRCQKCTNSIIEKIDEALPTF